MRNRPVVFNLPRAGNNLKPAVWNPLSRAQQARGMVNDGSPNPELPRSCRSSGIKMAAGVSLGKALGAALGLFEPLLAILPVKNQAATLGLSRTRWGIGSGGGGQCLVPPPTCTQYSLPPPPLPCSGALVGHPFTAEVGRALVLANDPSSFHNVSSTVLTDVKLGHNFWALPHLPKTSKPGRPSLTFISTTLDFIENFGQAIEHLSTVRSFQPH